MMHEDHHFNLAGAILQVHSDKQVANEPTDRHLFVFPRMAPVMRNVTPTPKACADVVRPSATPMMLVGDSSGTLDHTPTCDA